MNNIDLLKQFLRERYPKQWEHRHFVYVFADQCIASCVNYATTILFINALGLEDYGRYGLILAFIGFFAALHNALILMPMSSILPQLEASKKSGAAYGWVLKHLAYVLGAFCCMLGLVGFLEQYNPSWVIAVHLLPLSFLFVSYLIQEFLRRYFLIEAMYKEMLFYSVISNVTQVVVLLYFFSKGELNLDLILLAISLTSFVAIIYAFFKTTLFHPKHYPFEELMLSDGMKVGSWYTLSTIMGSLCAQVSLPLIGNILGLRLFGAFTAIGNCFLGINLTIVSFGNYRLSKLTPIAKNYHPMQLLHVIFKQNTLIFIVLAAQLILTGLIGQFLILHQLLLVLEPNTIFFLLLVQAALTLLGILLSPVDVANQILQNAKYPSLVRSVQPLLGLLTLLVLLKYVGIYAMPLNACLTFFVVYTLIYAQYYRRYERRLKRR